MTVPSPTSLLAALALCLSACAPTERTCASDTDCLVAEACVLGADGGRCTVRSPADPTAAPSPVQPDAPADEPGAPGEPSGEPAPPSDDPATPTDPVEPTPGAPRITSHGVAAGAGAAHSASYRVTHRLTATPRRTLVGSTLEVGH